MTQEVKNALSGDVILAAGYRELGGLLTSLVLVSLALTMRVILFDEQMLLTWLDSWQPDKVYLCCACIQYLRRARQGMLLLEKKLTKG